jgi:hypothetical protein
MKYRLIEGDGSFWIFQRITPEEGNIRVPDINSRELNLQKHNKKAEYFFELFVNGPHKKGKATL